MPSFTNTRRLQMDAEMVGERLRGRNREELEMERFLCMKHSL